MDVTDRIAREILNARRQNFTFNSILLGKQEILELKNIKSDLDEDEVELSRDMPVIHVNEKFHISVANVLAPKKSFDTVLRK